LVTVADPAVREYRYRHLGFAATQARVINRALK